MSTLIETPEPLTPRESEVLDTFARRGLSSAEIARELGVGKRTVDFHWRNICGKARVGTRDKARVIFCDAGGVRPECVNPKAAPGRRKATA